MLRAPLEIEPTREQNRAAAWITVALDEPLHLARGARYWLVLQALEGEVAWGAAPAADVPLQASIDGARSWAEATDARVPGPLTALHRVRVTPERFTVPISLDVGSEHLTLEQFEPLARLDFTIDTPSLAQALGTAAVEAGAHACPDAEHLVNAELTDWVGVGDALSAAETLWLEGSPRAVALAPDGRRAHVATVAQGNDGPRAVLETVSLVCGAASEPVELGAGDELFEPVLIAVGAAGDRAYVLGDRGGGDAFLAIVDLGARRRIGDIVDLDPLRGLVVAADGERVLLLRGSSDEVRIGAIDARALDRLAVDGSYLAEQLVPVAALELDGGERVVPHIPAAFASGRGDGDMLLAFAVAEIDEGATGAAKVVLVTEGETSQPRRIDIGPGPRALAMTTDGRRAVVACADVPPSLSVIDTEAGTATSIALEAAPVALTLSADGTRAAVVFDADVAVYDLDAAVRLMQEPVGSGLVAVAGSPRLDVLLVASSLASSLARFTTAAVPAGWVLTSGAVEPRCLGADLVAVLGRRRHEGTLAEPREPSSLSQIVAVAGGCHYEFSFRALADQPASAGEVLWRNGECGLARADRVPIAELDPPVKGRRDSDEAELVLHRLAVEAPAGTAQAEVRFTVPTGGLAAVGSVRCGK